MLIFITEREGKIKSIAGGLNTEMISRGNVTSACDLFEV